MAGAGGATEGELRSLSRRCVVVLRTGTVATAGGAALFQTPFPLVFAVVVPLYAWSALYARWVRRRWLVPADTVVIVALCLAQGWLVRPDTLPDITNWVLAVAAITAVGHQWLTTTAGGVLLTGVLVAAYLAGNLLAAPGNLASAVAIGMSVCGAAALSRLLWFNLYAAADRADEAVAASERAGRDAAVAAARRADEREHLAVLHDTAAATLFAVGTRMVEGTEPWFVEQAARDLKVLVAQPESADGTTDLAGLLGEVAQQVPVDVRLRVPHPLPVPAAAASAIGAAAREALTNVARHAGVATAEVAASRTGTMVVVEVADRGRGFTRTEVPPHRRGVAESIEQRMSRIGGLGVVLSRPGGGTVVRLEWPGE